MGRIRRLEQPILRAAFLSALFVIVFVGSTTLAQPSQRPTINLGPVIPVSPAGGGMDRLLFRASAESERVLMICGTRQSSRNISWEGFLDVSFDAGRTWTETLVDSSSQWSSEHSCALGIDNRAYFMAGVSNTDTGQPRPEFGRMYLYSSDDAGRTWKHTTTGSFIDWTNTAVDRTQGPNRGRIYLLGNHGADGSKWVEGCPLLLTSDDGGRTLNGPVFPPKPLTYMRTGTFPTDRVVLNDGTLVAVFFSTRGDGQGYSSPTNRLTNPRPYLEVGRSTDGGRTFNEPIILNDGIGGYPSLAVDRKRDIVYAAWIARDKDHNRLMIAQSKDRGASWQSHVVIDGGSDPMAVSSVSPSIAVGPDGVIGLVWPAANGTCFRFAISQDQGKSFGEATDLNPCGQSFQLRPESYVDYLSSYPTIEKGFGQGTVTDAPLRGASIRLEPGRQAIGNPILLVDDSGDFHPIWRERFTQLWTRTVTVGKQSSPPSLGIENLTEISKSVGVRLTNNNFRLASSTFYLDVSLVNLGAAPICSPIRLVASGLRSDYGTPAIDNADNGLSGDGAIWDMTSSLDAGVLGPWATSGPRTLSVQVKNLNESVDRGNPFAVGFKIYGKSGAACSPGR